MTINWSIIIVFVINCYLVAVTTSRAANQDEQYSHSKFKFINESKECSEDVRRICPEFKRTDDLTLLNCLQDTQEVMKSISTGCQHFLWLYKKALTTSDYLNGMTTERCGSSVNAIEECKSVKIGHKVPCLLDHKMEITDKQCHTYLNKVGIMIFSDYHLIYKFVDKCNADIKKSQCGRLNKNGDLMEDTNEDKEAPASLADYITSQADTVDCLINTIANLSKPCQHEILRLSELQSDDYHLNRKLYMACREDRDVLCSNVQSGEGRVYKCLMKHKFSDRMSKPCQDQLTKKQQVEAIDAKANYPLFANCKADIDKHQCSMASLSKKEEVLQMSTVLLCLEDVETRGGKIEPNCKAELTQKRLEMIEDYRVSPEVVVACIDDVKNYCDKTDKRPGAVLHCLMQLAAADDDHPKGRLNEHCRVALSHLLKAANPTEDVMLLDPTIRQACSSSFNTLCTNSDSKDQAFQCLVQNLGSPDMAPDCRGNLTSLLYFVSYDFTIDSAVERACHKDAMRLCDGPKTVQETRQRTEIQRKLEYHCMYKQYQSDRVQIDIAAAQGLPVSQVKRALSPDCANEIFRLVKAQAMHIQLDPIVFDSCLLDLGKHCQGPKHKGREHECLQANFDHLQAGCQKAIIDFSQMEDADMRLNHQLTEACMPMTKLFCSKKTPEEMLHCLILHKRHPDMIASCQAAIEHFQIMSLEEYRIDHRFAKFCKKEIEEYCADELKGTSKDDNDDGADNKVVSKVAIVSCLSKTVVKKLVAGELHPLSKMCRRQFSFELLQRSDSITLDENLLKDCKRDIDKHCKHESPDKVATCLRTFQNELENRCHRRIFQRERLESLDANFDGRLRRVCALMIEEHCSDAPGTQLFQCLHKKINDVEFDEDCRQLIFLRLERRMNDIRLNPGLLKDCREDIKTYCKQEHLETMEPKNGIEFEGIVIQCLKETFSNDSRRLQPRCRERILKIIIEANAYLRLDPILRKKCMPVIKEHCNKEFQNQMDKNVGSVHDCLKHKLLLKKIDLPECAHEISRLLREGQADVHVDMQLFDACQDAIMKLCRSENLGNGRKMSCLLYFADDKKASKLLDSRCLRMIKERREMWSLAANFEPQSLQDLVLQVNQSSMRTYLFSMVGLMILALVLLGICCGRITKRVPVDLKNK